MRKKMRIDKKRELWETRLAKKTKIDKKQELIKTWIAKKRVHSKVRFNEELRSAKKLR